MTRWDSLGRIKERLRGFMQRQLMPPAEQRLERVLEQVTSGEDFYSKLPSNNTLARAIDRTRKATYEAVRTMAQAAIEGSMRELPAHRRFTDVMDWVLAEDRLYALGLDEEQRESLRDARERYVTKSREELAEDEVSVTPIASELPGRARKATAQFISVLEDRLDPAGVPPRRPWMAPEGHDWAGLLRYARERVSRRLERDDPLQRVQEMVSESPSSGLLSNPRFIKLQGFFSAEDKDGVGKRNFFGSQIDTEHYVKLQRHYGESEVRNALGLSTREDTKAKLFAARRTPIDVNGRVLRALERSGGITLAKEPMGKTETVSLDTIRSSAAQAYLEGEARFKDQLQFTRERFHLGFSEVQFKDFVLPTVIGEDARYRQISTEGLREHRSRDVNFVARLHNEFGRDTIIRRLDKIGLSAKEYKDVLVSAAKNRSYAVSAHGGLLAHIRDEHADFYGRFEEIAGSADDIGDAVESVRKKLGLDCSEGQVKRAAREWRLRDSDEFAAVKEFQELGAHGSQEYFDAVASLFGSRFATYGRLDRFLGVSESEVLKSIVHSGVERKLGMSDYRRLQKAEHRQLLGKLQKVVGGVINDLHADGDLGLHEILAGRYSSDQRRRIREEVRGRSGLALTASVLKDVVRDGFAYRQLGMSTEEYVLAKKKSESQADIESVRELSPAQEYMRRSNDPALAPYAA